MAPTIAVMIQLLVSSPFPMFIEDLIKAFDLHRNAENAFHMKAYMRNKFDFFGIKATERRRILREVIIENRSEVRNDFRSIVEALYQYPQRELHLCAMEIFFSFAENRFERQDLKQIEFLICTNSWWDTVDYIAKHILGSFLKQFPDLVEAVLERYSNSNDLWLKRSTILFQLGYKNNTDKSLLFNQCQKFSDSKEFFLQKAIGWALREYARINPEDVLNFVNSHDLKPLSKREAIRNII
ncbi:MAG: DNA alkylation repair protein [Flavobacteriaceae bacterium]|nr:DNA alkylation repair protein [Flavobacteriaceae bacterium]